MKKAIRTRLKLMRLSMIRETKRCIFCGKSTTSREHVFPTWTHPYLLPNARGRNKFTVQIQFRKRLESTTFNVPPARGWTIKCVCKACNNVWMSQLETRMRNVALPLITGARTSLSDKDKETIATWAVLKASVVNHKITPRAVRYELRKTKKVPDGWAVWIANFERVNWLREHASTPFSIQPNYKFEGGRRPRDTWRSNCHAHTQIIKKLFIHAVYCPYGGFVDGWRFTPPRCRTLTGNLLKIWPPTGVGIRHWPQKALTDADAELATYAILSAVIGMSRRLFPEDSL